MQSDGATKDGREGDDVRAHQLFRAAYAIKAMDDGQPTELSLTLLKAASLAWQRHIRSNRRTAHPGSFSQPPQDQASQHQR